MKNFFQTVKDSIYSPQFYSEIPSKSFKASLGFFFLVILILAIIKLASLYNPLVNTAPAQLKKSIGQLIDCYPSDLEIDIKEGQATTSASEPYFISCNEAKNASASAILVIDTKTPYSKEQFDKYGVPAWLNQKELFLKENDMETKSYDLSKLKNFKVNKGNLESIYQSSSKYFVFVGPGLLLLAFIFIFCGYIFNLIYLLIFSLLLLLIFNVLKKEGYNYLSLYKTGLYAITGSMILEFLIDILRPWTHFAPFPFMFTLITLIIVFFNILNPKKTI